MSMSGSTSYPRKFKNRLGLRISVQDRSFITQKCIAEVYPFLFDKYKSLEEIASELNITRERVFVLKNRIYDLMGVDSYEKFIYWAREGCPQVVKR